MVETAKQYSSFNIAINPYKLSKLEGLKIEGKKIIDFFHRLGNVIFLPKGDESYSEYLKDSLPKEERKKPMISVGGDGTSSSVNAFCRDENIPQIVLKAGTGNDLGGLVNSKEFKSLYQNPKEIMEILEKKKFETKKLDYIEYQINNKDKKEGCLLCLTGGVIAASSYLNKFPWKGLKKVTSKIYKIKALSDILLGYKPSEIVVELDGKKVYEGPQMGFSLFNVNSIGGGNLKYDDLSRDEQNEFVTNGTAALAVFPYKKKLFQRLKFMGLASKLKTKSKGARGAKTYDGFTTFQIYAKPDKKRKVKPFVFSFDGETFPEDVYSLTGRVIKEGAKFLSIKNDYCALI